MEKKEWCEEIEEQGVSSNSKKAGRKFVMTQKNLCAFSVFMRVLIVVTWCSALLSLALQGYLAYQIVVSAFLYGLIAAFLWFTLGNIHTTEEIEWSEVIVVEKEEQNK